MNSLSKFFFNIGASLTNNDIKGISGFYQYLNNRNFNFDYQNLPELINDSYARNADVYSITSYIARNASNIKWHVKEYFADGSHEINNDTPLQKIIENPNSYQTWGEFLEEHYIYRLLTGNSFIHGIKPEGFDYFQELRNLVSQYVEIKTKNNSNNADDIIGYNNINNIKDFYDKENILHTKYPNPCDTISNLYGISPLESTLKVWKTSSERWTASANVLKNRGVSGILTDNSDRPMTPEQAKQMQSQANQRLGGSEKFGQVMVSNKKLDFIKMGLSPQDMELLDLGVITLRALCNAYHVDSSLFNDPANKTFNNRKEAQKALWTDAILPEIHKTENALNSWLVKPISQSLNKNLVLCPELDNIEPLQQDMDLIADRLTKLRMAGIISGNDARRQLGLDSIDDESMDSVYISMNQVDITENENLQNEK
tara:strand:+ start:7912 stop:9195 length:1284 start_codon:yes stop_codon:yes gene_type:complete